MLFFIPFYYTFASNSTPQCSGIEKHKAGASHCLRLLFLIINKGYTKNYPLLLYLPALKDRCFDSCIHLIQPQLKPV